MKYAVLTVVACLALAGCRRVDERSFVVRIPALAAETHETVVAALAPFGGVDKRSYKFDDAAHTLTLRYDSMQLAKKNIEMAIAAAGLEANGVTPESVGAKRR